MLNDEAYGTPTLIEFVCPVADCPKTFGSPKARCPVHGRQAVPA